MSEIVEPDNEPVIETSAPVNPVPNQEPVQKPAPSAEPVEPVSDPVQVVPVEPKVPATQAPEKTGIPYYDSAGDILYNAGMDASDIMDKVVANGNKIPDDIRASMVEKLGESQVYMLESGLATQVSAQEKERSTVLDSIGGEEVWDAVNAWASSTTSLQPDQISAYNEMLTKGGQQAIIAAQKLKEAYMADPNTTVPATNMINGDTAAPVQSGIEPISRMQYTEAKRKAVNENNAVEVSKLEARARFTSAQKPDLWRPQFGRF